MEEVIFKSILSRKNDGDKWFGISYNMNLYRGCSHGCIYCDSRSECYGIEDFEHVKPKKDALTILNRELASKKKKGVVGIGSMSDSYNSLEKELKITRGALELLENYGFGISLETKSTLIVRDLDLLLKINKKQDVIIKFTITCSDDNLSKKIEPYASRVSDRLKAIKELSSNGIFVGVLMMPILPFIEDNEENIRNIVKLSYQNGAKFIYSYFGVTLRDRQREFYYKKLQDLFPGLKNKYIKTYGDSYMCNSEEYNKLYKVFTNECQKYNLLYKMEDIIASYKKQENKLEQIRLF